MPQQFTSVMTAMRLMASFIGIAFVVLFLWMIKKLASRDVKEEFRSS
jgi:flagellar biogenesis protein FliO